MLKQVVIIMMLGQAFVAEAGTLSCDIMSWTNNQLASAYLAGGDYDVSPNANGKIKLGKLLYKTGASGGAKNTPVAGTVTNTTNATWSGTIEYSGSTTNTGNPDTSSSTSAGVRLTCAPNSSCSYSFTARSSNAMGAYGHTIWWTPAVSGTLQGASNGYLQSTALKSSYYTSSQQTVQQLKYILNSKLTSTTSATLPNSISLGALSTGDNDVNTAVINSSAKPITWTLTKAPGNGVGAYVGSNKTLLSTTGQSVSTSASGYYVGLRIPQGAPAGSYSAPLTATWTCN